MPDDIFEYFGGNSSRKVEPLDEDEMFEDLLPEKNEPEATADSVEDSEPEIIEAELIEKPADEASEVVAAANQSDTEIQAEAPLAEQAQDSVVDPWSDLANSLGLDPTPASPSKARTSVVLGEVGLVADLGGNQKQEKEKQKDEQPEMEKDVRPAQQHFVDEQDEDAEDLDNVEEVLSEMFVPQEDLDAYSHRESLDEFDDDPFAAFSGATRHAADESAEPEPDEIDEIDEPFVDLEPESDPDFVEFEVTDLGGRVDKDREKRTERRPKRRRRSRGDDDARDKAEGDDARDKAEGDDRQMTEQSRTDEQPEHKPKQRGGRRGSRETAQQRDDYREDKTREPEAGGKTRDRDSKRDLDRDRDREDEDEDEGDNRDKKKKPRIPTWQEAIGVVVDENIKRHESNTNSGRGGSRRRRRN